MPGYTFEEYLSGTAADNITNKVSGSTVTIADNSADVYLSVSFKQPSSIEGTEPEKTPPTAPVTDNPIVVVDDNALPDGANSSLIRLISDEPTPDNKTAMEAIVKEAGTQFDQVVYTEIALVEITKDPDGKILTTAPIQPKDGKSVTLYCPYPAGTNSSYTFTIFHKKWDGTTEIYSTALQNLENTPNGLMFRVSSFSPLCHCVSGPCAPCLLQRRPPLRGRCYYGSDCWHIRLRIVEQLHLCAYVGCGLRPVSTCSHHLAWRNPHAPFFRWEI